MTRMRSFVAALAGAAVSCSGGGDGGNGAPPETLLETLQGVWVTPCYNPGGAPDQRQQFTYTGTTRVVVTTVFSSRDGSCTGTTGVQQPPPQTGTFTLGATRPATLAGASVTATEADVVLPGQPVRYAIIYVDTSRTPRVLYGGDVVATLGLDGLTPAARPTVLEDWRPRVRDGGAAPPDLVKARLQGNWTACRRSLLDRREINHVVGGTSTVTGFWYPSGDGSCSGEPSFDGSGTATFLVGANAPATLSAVPVVARAVDLTPPGGGISFGVVHVDATSGPDRLFAGDTSADAARDGTTPARRPLVLANPWTRLPALGESTTTLDALQGSWTTCYNEGNAASDVRETLAISGTNVEVTTVRFTNSFDSTCKFAGTPDPPLTAAVTLGATAPATLLDTLVAAREVDLQVAGGSDKGFTILWVDASASPPVLYTGDEIVNPYRDASAPDRRPTVLQAGRPRQKTPAPAASSR